MIKKLLLTVCLTFGVDSYVEGAQAPVNSNLHCHVISCRDIEFPTNSNSWCDNTDSLLLQTDFTPLRVHSPSCAQNSECWGNELNDGDQFQRLFISKWNPHQLDPIYQGEVQDGYHWMDGEHIRFILQIECTPNR